MLSWTSTEKKKLNAQLRKVTKLSPGIPNSTSNDKLAALGMHTIDEIAEAQRNAQLVRLSGPPVGRAILAKLGHDPTLVMQDHVDIPRDVRNRITIRPIPRNVHPDNNTERRLATGKFLLSQAHRNPDCSAFVDVAAYTGNRAFVTMGVNGCGDTVN